MSLINKEAWSNKNKPFQRHFKAVIEESNNIKIVHSNMNDYNPKKDPKILIVLNDMIPGIISKEWIITHKIAYLR